MSKTLVFQIPSALKNKEKSAKINRLSTTDWPLSRVLEAENIYLGTGFYLTSTDDYKRDICIYIKNITK